MFLFNMVNELIIGLNNGLKKNFYNYNELETAMDEYTLVAKDGSLLTVLEIDGIREIISGQTYINRIINNISMSLSNSLEKRGHVIQSCFHYNPAKSEILIDQILKPSYETCKRLNLDLEYMLDAQKEESRHFASEEKNFLLIWTNSGVLTKQEVKRAVKDRVEEFKNSKLPVTSHGSNPFAAIEAVYNRHRSTVDSIENEFNHVGVVIKKLDVSKAIREIRMGVDEAYTSPEWKAFLPGNRMLPVQMKQHQHSEEWDIITPKVSQQICNKDAEIVNNKIVKVGEVYYAPIYIDLMPKEITFFSELFKKLISFGIPWRIMYTITGDGMAAIAFKHTIAQLLHVTSQSNKMFNESAKYLKQLVNQHETIVKLQISLCTWADNEKQAENNVSQLARAVENWGSCNVSEITGNPISGLASASMGFTSRGIATVSAAPISDAITMLPFSRPSSLWQEGAVILKSTDGKLLPYQPMTSLQTTWITLIFAGPGSGKSVFTNMTNIALCLSPGIERLPLISILDIGPSSKGFIELMKDALPVHQKHYALYTRITNSTKYATNPFDTKLGCRYPIQVDKEFLINLLSLLMTDPSEYTPPVGIIPFVRDVVTAAYEYYSDSPSYTKNHPKRYSRKECIEVDNKLIELGIDINKINSSRIDQEYDEDDKQTDNQDDGTMHWWQVVDILSKNGCIREASLAQRYAVPVLSDLTNISKNTRQIVDLYKDLKIGNENIIDAFARMISSAIDAYPVFSGITQYDLGEARIISLDLDQVATGDGPQGIRQTAVMYMYGMRLISGDFFINADNIDEMPFISGVKTPPYCDVDMYKAYHKKRIKEIREDKKRLSIDEFHRTSKTEMVREQVKIYMREGRKWGVEIILASQSIDDFDERMVEFATATFVMSAGGQSTVDNIVRRIGVNDEAEIDVLKNRIRPPSKMGNVFMGKFQTKQGNFTQLLNNKMGPIQIWALSTTVDDVKIRDMMFAEVGSLTARKILAEAFPSGSAASEVENRRRHLDEDQLASVHEQIVNEIIYKLGPKYGIDRKRYMNHL